ncbi:hypothetical protein DFH07DRAFT_800837 [Mycena maculata]|uniref:Uncharacterized protein n=1 Tax=Mycena maculata TaxID=230809 RepID=A0AAD7K298_9AGAR|nr:hypothetical protein DFH07DRAFT_800837 [Mycena maculata]
MHMHIQRSWLLFILQAAVTFTPLHAESSLDPPSLIPRDSSESIFAEFAKVGPIIAGVLGGLSAILLLLLMYRLRRKYILHARLRARRAGTSGEKRGILRFFGKRERSPSSYWDEYPWEKDLEAFPRGTREPRSSVASADRPLPTVPALTRASSHRDETEGAPLFPSGQPVRSDSSSLNVTNPSRTKLRVRPDPMLIQEMLTPVQQLEERRRDLAGSTPARRTYVGIPPPMPPLVKIHPPPPGLGFSHGRSQSEGASPGGSTTPATRGRSQSEGNGRDVQEPDEAEEELPRRRRHRSFTAQVLSPIEDGSMPINMITAPTLSTQRMSRHQLTMSLQQTQEAMAALEEMLSVSDIDIPPLTAHSRFSSTHNTHLRDEIEILQREVRRLQTLLLAPRRNDSTDTGLDSEADSEPNPPPVYST